MMFHLKFKSSREFMKWINSYSGLYSWNVDSVKFTKSGEEIISVTCGKIEPDIPLNPYNSKYLINGERAPHTTVD